ncbi:hypothetical protein GUI43_01894 [Micromonospora noduli]|nr:hypothetical protein GUI43_01894 [Micromonospora noduli]
MVREDGDAHRHGHQDRPGVRLDGDGRVAHRRAEPLGHDRRAPRVGLRQQQHELLTTLAEGQVDLTDLPAHPPGELGQDGVPRGVPVGVVDVLEPVQVQCEDAEHPPEAAGPFHLPPDRLAQVAVVPQPGERVGEGEPLRLLVHPDVVHRDGRMTGESAQGGQVFVVELVGAQPVVESQHAERGRRVRLVDRPGGSADGGRGTAGRGGERNRDVGAAVWLARWCLGRLRPAPLRFPGGRDLTDHADADRHPERLRPVRLLGRPAPVQPLGALRDEHPAGLHQQYGTGTRAGRPDGTAQDHPQDALQVVRAGQRVAEHREMPAQLIPVAGQRRDVGAGLPGHPVERGGQPSQLVATAYRHPGGQVTLGHPVDSTGQLRQRPGGHPGQPPGGQHREQPGQHDHPEKRGVQPRWPFTGHGEHQWQRLRVGGPEPAHVPALVGLGDLLAPDADGCGQHRVADVTGLGRVGDPRGARPTVEQGDRHPGHRRQPGHEGRVDQLRGGHSAQPGAGAVVQVDLGRQRTDRAGRAWVRAPVRALGRAGAVLPRGRRRTGRQVGDLAGHVGDQHRGGQTPADQLRGGDGRVGGERHRVGGGA